MFGIGGPELNILAVVIIVLVGGWLARLARGGVRIAGPTLVLRRFKVDETPSANLYVDIAGRRSGIIAWILTVIGFDAETSLKSTGQNITFKSSSLFGQIHRVVPLSKISSTHCGYSKPIGYLIIGVIFIVIGVLSNFFPMRILWQFGLFGSLCLILGLVIGGIFLIAYWLSKKMTMFLETSGGMTIGLTFKRSVIENVPVDINKALKAISILNQKVMESQIK